MSPALDDETWIASLPRKVVTAAAVLRDTAGRLLLLRDALNGRWTLPGGGVDTAESPSSGCRRELLEETGLDIAIGQLLVVTYSPAGAKLPERITFAFDAGIASSDAENRTLDGAHRVALGRGSQPGSPSAPRPSAPPEMRDRCRRGRRGALSRVGVVRKGDDLGTLARNRYRAVGACRRSYSSSADSRT